jgi:hypothetical protein
LAYQISQHERAAQNQISQQIGDFMRTQVYGQAPQEKPDNCIWVIMENFNSLGIFTKGTKINSLNKLCQQFNTNIVEGCKTQVEWSQSTTEQQFRNLIGVGMENWKVFAYIVNKRMKHNQHGGCAMMALG